MKNIMELVDSVSKSNGGWDKDWLTKKSHF